MFKQSVDLSRLLRAFGSLASLFLFCNAHAGPGTALNFNGTNAYVQVPHTAALDSLPLTITAWVRTTRTAANADGIVSKYVDGSFSGYSLHLLNGHVRAWYFRDGANYVYDGSQGLDGGFIADGNWHHLAFVVDTSGGKLFVDGTMKSNLVWHGTAQATITTTALQFGRYSTYATALLGALDEVTIWNRALATNEVNYLKHRLLPTNADGLVGYWKFDDGFGLTATDSTANHFNGSLVNSPQWIPSDAPVVLNSVSTNCLRFDGANGYVTVAHSADLDSYPFTATAWFRTTNSANVFQGLVSKYVNASGNGWCIMVQNGLLRGFYYRQVTNRAIDFTYALSVADGAWHHTAMTVDAAGGHLWLDGVQVGTGTWVATPGGTTGTDPLLIGRFDTVAARFLGVIDEVSVWKRALTAGEIQTNRNFPLVGNESNLVAYWRLDEGTGTAASDSSGLGHTGSLVSAPAWVGSTAYLGDGSVHLAGAMDFVNFSQTFAINTSPGQPAFLANSGAGFWRFYDFGSAPASSSVIAQIAPGLQIASAGTSVNINPVSYSVANTFGAYNASSPIPTGAASGQLFLTPGFSLQPAPGVQLNAVDNLHQAVAVLSHNENGGAFSNDATNSTIPTRLLQFDGNLFFGSLLTLFTNLDVTPVVTNVVAGNRLDCSLVVSLNAGNIPGAPGHTYGAGIFGTALPVSLLLNGDAVLKAGASTAFAGPVPDVGTIQNISFSRNNSLLTSTGAIAYLDVLMPLGFSIGISPTNRETIPFAPLGYSVLDANLNPTNTSYVVGGPLFGVEETMPYWFGAPNLTWQVNSGQIILNPNATSVFVRQQEDAILQSQTGLTDPTTTNRVSNDGYFRNATPGGGPLIVTADSNGVAQVSAQLALNPPALRPHFPYSGRANGNQIQTSSGLLVISNTQVGAGSFLNVGALPLAYGRDCNYPGCTAAQAGPATLSFTVSGGQLSFTPDGGLVGYGSISPVNLMWGYATGGNFAQQAGAVSSGAFCMAGTFLLAGQSTLDPSQSPTVILFSGFGDASNPSYSERPGLPSYNDGFANYPGLNFRSPAQGWSYLGQHNFGPYALDPVSKYYVRIGGVNGIHQAAGPPGPLLLYGYNFTFSDYGLSYLDGLNWDTVTTGAVTFPAQPAGFTQEFDKMKVTCRGDLDSAHIPAGGSPKHLAYWNADFTPQSIDFHPTNNDTCGTSPRFLVLGVETKLPFIPQALHAALGFKPSGNLVCPQDNVSNVDSRFKVPAQLSLKGPTNSMFTISTAAEGYFNNWETPGAAALGTGFYNLAGKIRVPFFTDLKVHLHVTPANATTAQVDIMGGWPDPDSGAADLGWSVNNSNFFNMVEFDPHSDGWPVAQVPNLNGYINSTTTQYHPRAQRDWLDVAKFDYPLVFDSVLRRFKGMPGLDAKVELPILDVNSRLKQLAPGLVDFDFAQDLNLQLPQIKVLNLVNDALDGDIGPLMSVSNAIRGALNQTLDVTGINSLSKALREDAQDFLKPILAPALDPVVATLTSNLQGIQQTNVPLFLQTVYNNITQPNGPIAAGIGTLNNVSNQASSVILTVNKVMTDVLNTAGLLDRVIAKDPSSGERKVVTTIIEKIVADQSPGLGFTTPLIGSTGDAILNPLLADLDPTLTEIQGDLEDVSNQLAQVQSGLGSVSGGFNMALGAVLQDATGISNVLAAAAQNVTNYLASVITPAGDLLTANPAAVQQTIRDQITAAFLGSVMAGNYQSTLRNFLGDDNFALNQIMNSLFDQINSTIRNGLADQIKGAQDGLLQQMKGAGLLGGSLGSAKIKGAPVFDGDSLRDIHLNAAIQLNIPDKMNFNAYMDIKELNSQSVPVGCIPAGGPAAEITLGADKVPLNWAGVSSGQSAQSLTLSLQARWTQQSSTVAGKTTSSVIGLGGKIAVGGSASFEGCQLKDLEATLVIGQVENYFSTKADATVPILGIPVNFKAGLFAGHACSLAPLLNIDPQADKVLLNNPSAFSGVYVQCGGGLSLSDLLGLGGLGCLLDADASVSYAYYWQGGASLGIIGGREDMDVKISLLCVLSGELQFAEFLAIDTSGALTVGGSADVCGSIGPCPFCLSGCKGVTIKGVVSTHGVDYFIDY